MCETPIENVHFVFQQRNVFLSLAPIENSVYLFSRFFFTQTERKLDFE